MVTKIYLIRHGETEGAETKCYKGHIDVPLSENGVKQMGRLAKYLIHNDSELHNAKQKLNPPLPPFYKGGEGGLLNAVYSSDLIRAVKSAEIIAEPYGLKPIIIKALRERNFGAWEGMTFDEIKEKYPDAFNAWAENPLKFSPIEGESTIEVKERSLKTLNEIIEKHKGQNIAIVAHGGINRIILCHFLGVPLENIFRIEQDFGALNVIELWDYPVVKHINYVV